MQGIYYIENTKTQRRYYGSSFNIEKRLTQHKQDLGKRKHHNIQLQRTYNKYGNIFRYVTLEETNFNTREELLEYEQKFLDKNINGYNMAPANGGNILGTHPDKEKIREKILKTHSKTIKNLSSEEKKKKFGRSKEKTEDGNKVRVLKFVLTAIVQWDIMQKLAANVEIEQKIIIRFMESRILRKLNLF